MRCLTFGSFVCDITKVPENAPWRAITFENILHNIFQPKPNAKYWFEIRGRKIPGWQTPNPPWITSRDLDIARITPPWSHSWHLQWTFYKKSVIVSVNVRSIVSNQQTLNQSWLPIQKLASPRCEVKLSPKGFLAFGLPSPPSSPQFPLFLPIHPHLPAVD